MELAEMELAAIHGAGGEMELAEMELAAMELAANR